MKILSTVSLISLIFGAKETLAQKKKPNVLIILADDVGTGDVPGYWGNEIVDMPNLRALQEKGVTFTDAHSTPLCAPSRYALLSGNQPHRGTEVFGTWGIYPSGQTQFYGRQQSIASMLKTGDYHTSMFGKWHIGGGLPGDYNQTHLLSSQDWENGKISNGPSDHGFDDSFYTLEGIQGAPYSYFRNGKLLTEEENIVYWEKGEHVSLGGNTFKILNPGEGDKHWDSTSYNKKIYRKAEKFIDDHVKNHSDKPFFMYFSLGSVHIPHTPPDQYFDGTKIAGRYEDPHLDLLFEMDLIVGSLTKKLEDTNLMEDTLIIFTSDNGGLHKEYPNRVLRGFKGNLYENGHRVPFIMRYDGVLPAGERRDEHYIALWDIYATIAQFTDLKIDQYSAQDSKSFKEYAISGSAGAPRKYLTTYKPQQDKHQAAIRDGDFKFIRDYINKWEALYNLKDDIGEKHNLLVTDFGKYNSLRKKLRNKLRKNGPCPADRNHSFKLRHGKKAGTVVDCSFFQKYSKSKCYWQPFGEVVCNSICGRFRKFCGLWKDYEAKFLDN